MARILGSDLCDTRSHSSRGADSVSTTTPLSLARDLASGSGSGNTTNPSTATTLPLTLATNGRYPRPRSHVAYVPRASSVLPQPRDSQTSLMAPITPSDHFAASHCRHATDGEVQVGVNLPPMDSFNVGAPHQMAMLANPWEVDDGSATDSEDGTAEEERAVLAALESMARPPIVEGGPLLLPMPVRPAELNRASRVATSILSTAHASSRASSDGHEWHRAEHVARPLGGTDQTMATSLFSAPVLGTKSQKLVVSGQEAILPIPTSASKAKQLIAMFEKVALISEPGNDGRLSSGYKEAPIFDLAPCIKGPRLLRPSDQCGNSSLLSQCSQSLAKRPTMANDDTTVVPRSSPNSPRLHSPSSNRPRGLQHSRIRSNPGPSAQGDPEGGRAPSSEISLNLPLSDLIPKPPQRDLLIRDLRSSPQRRVSPTQSLSYRSIGDPGSATVGLAGAKRQEGTIWYYDVHLSSPEWVRAQAILFTDSLGLSWIPRGGGRQNVMLDLTRCREVHSLPSVDDSGVVEGDGSKLASGQVLASMKPFQFVFGDGVERMAADSIRQRSQWVRAAQDVLSECRASPLSPLQQPQQQREQEQPRQQGPYLQQQALPAPRSRSPTSHKRSSPTLSRPPQHPRHSDSQLHRIGAAWERKSLHDQESPGRVASIVPALASHSPDLISSEFGQLQTVPQKLATHVQPIVQAQSLRPAMDRLTYALESPGLGQSQAFASEAGKRPSLSPAKGPERLRVTAATSHPRRSSASPQLSEGTFVRFPSASALTLGATDELLPDDSASQRPPRSEAEERHELPELLTSFRRSGPEASVLQSIKVGQIVPPDVLEAASPTKTPAQIFRDSVLEQASRGAETQEVACPPPLPRAHAPIAELPPSQATSLKPQRMSTVVEETATQAERAAAASSKKRSPAASHSDGRQDTSREEVSQVLRYLEQERRSQASRDRAIEASLSQLQAKIEAAQAGQISVTKSGRGPLSATGDASNVRSNVSDASLLKLQEKLDRVLTLVNEVSERSEKESVAELKHISSVVNELLRKVRENGDASRTESAFGRPHVLNSAGLSKALPDAASISGSEYASAYPDAVQTLRPASMLTAATSFARPHKESSSVEGVPGASAKTKTDMVAGSSQHVRSGRASSVANPDGHEPLAVRQMRDLSPAGGDVTVSTLDMEAAVRERRRVRQSLEQDGARAAQILSRSATGETETEAIERMEQVTTAEERYTSRPSSKAPSLAASGAATRDAQAATVIPELIALQDALRESEEARKVQQRQQNDIARYLNQLNGWLEKDVTERQREFKNLSDGLSKLSVEVTSAQRPAFDASTTPAPAHQDGQWPFQPASEPPAQQTQAESWPFIVKKSGPSQTVRLEEEEDVDREGLTGAEADEARVAALQVAHEEIVNHIASQDPARTAGKDDEPARTVSEVLSEEATTELGDAAAKKNRGKIRKIVKEAAKAGAGMAAMATLMKAFHREKDNEKNEAEEEGEKEEDTGEEPGGEHHEKLQKDVGSAGIVQNVIETVTGTKAAQAFDTFTQGKKIIDALKDGKYDEVLDLLKEQKEQAQSHAADSSGPTGEGLPPAAAGVAEAAAAVPAALSHATQALNAVKEGKLTEALHALKEGHITEAVHSLKGEQATSQHGLGQRIRDGAMGIVGGAVLATAIEELLKHHQAREEREKAKEAEKEKKKAEKEAAKATAEKAREEQLAALQQKQSADIINALAEMLAAEKVRQEQAEAQKARILDPKTAIEALVSALNEVRLEEAAKRAASDKAIAELAERMIEATVHQHGVLLGTLATMSKDLVKSSVDDHLKQFRGTMAASFAGSAEAMRDAWLAHAKEVGQVKAIEAPKPAGASKPAETQKPDKQKEAAPQPPKARDPRPLGPYGVPPLSVPRADPRR